MNIESISHVVLDIVDTKELHRKVMVMSGSYEINSEFEHGRKNEVIYCKVIPNSHFFSFQFNNDDISLMKTFSTKPLSEFSNHDPDEICIFSNISSQTLNDFQFSFYDPIEVCLEELVLKKFPLCSRFHVVDFVNRKLDLIILIFVYEV
jgi:hypothetical protein